MVAHIAGENTATLRDALNAPQQAAFANEVISAAPDGTRTTRWVFWPRTAVSSGNADRLLAAIDLARFLRDQRIIETSAAFIFTGRGEVIALPDATRIAKVVHPDGQLLVAPPKIDSLNDPVIAGLVAAYQDGRMSGTRVYDAAGRTYIARVIDIPPRYGQDQLLAIIVPIDEIERPITEIRNQTLLYSIAFLLLALPMYVTLVVAWIDRRLENRAGRLSYRDDE